MEAVDWLVPFLPFVFVHSQALLDISSMKGKDQSFWFCKVLLKTCIMGVSDLRSDLSSNTCLKELMLLFLLNKMKEMG